jgi:hypothetical protein
MESREIKYGSKNVDEKSKDEGWERCEGAGWNARVNTYRGIHLWA